MVPVGDGSTSLIVVDSLPLTDFSLYERYFDFFTHRYFHRLSNQA